MLRIPGQHGLPAPSLQPQRRRRPVEQRVRRVPQPQHQRGPPHPPAAPPVTVPLPGRGGDVPRGGRLALPAAAEPVHRRPQSGRHEPQPAVQRAAGAGRPAPRPVLALPEPGAPQPPHHRPPPEPHVAHPQPPQGRAPVHAVHPAQLEHDARRQLEPAGQRVRDGDAELAHQVAEQLAQFDEQAAGRVAVAAAEAHVGVAQARGGQQQSQRSEEHREDGERFGREKGRGH